ncbi:MAG: sigma-70 family RNA polymerase sigma factor, partial [Isosphaeraceae bacterium]
DLDGFTQLDAEITQVLSKSEEREILMELAKCRKKLTTALKKIDIPDVEDDDPRAALTQLLANGDMLAGVKEARLGASFERYRELRTRLALANMRLVAHVAKRFRDRGIAYSDLIQEGFLGLLEAIDRFDLNHETKLATYATWWIRQAMQRAVASGAYPVRLSPRHLRQLAQCQEKGANIVVAESVESESDELPSDATELIQRIHTATRPTVSLNATIDFDSSFSLIHTISETEYEISDDENAGEMVARLISELRPREQQVLQLRFGLGGRQKLSLSQVGKVLAVSKERVRQIQDRALQRLREIAMETSNELATAGV